MAPVNVVTYHKCINEKSWYIYGKLLHLQTPMAPVNVTTHHKCINFFTFMVSHYIYVRHSCVPAGRGRVTRFPFGPPNVFVYISLWAARENYQNRPHVEGDYRNWWLTRALLDAIHLAASRRNMTKYLCKIGTWYYQIWYNFQTWSLLPKDFCMIVTETQHQLN